MFAVELLANSAVVCLVTLRLEHAKHFHISHIIWGLLPQIVECTRKYVDGISQNLQSLNPYLPCYPTIFSSLQIMVKQFKSSGQMSRY